MNDALVLCGDSREIVGGLDFDYVFTSPPYNLGTGPDGPMRWSMSYFESTALVPRNDRQSGMRKRRLRGVTSGYEDHDDRLPWPEYEELLAKVLGTCWDRLPEHGAMFVNMKPRILGGRLVTPMERLPERLVLRQIITWDRNTAPASLNHRHFGPTYEWVLLYAKPGFSLASQGASSIGDLWRVSAFIERVEGHPCPFPPALPGKAMAACPPGVWLDPFAGSGSTMVAATRLGLASIGVEISEAYCEVARRRLAEEHPALALEVEQLSLDDD